MEIKEFVLNKEKATDSVSKRVAQAKKSYAKKTHQADLQKLNENKPLIMLGATILMIVLTILLGMLVFKIPVVTICIVILIEAALAACLHDLPIWLHGVVMAAELILGIAVHQIIFMVLADLCYLAAIFLLKFIKEKAA